MKDRVGGLAASSGRCLCMVSRSGVEYGVGPAQCEDPPEWAGTVHFPYDGSVWLAFACDGHQDVLTGPHPITPAERSELDRRVGNAHKALAGQPSERPKPIRAGRAPGGRPPIRVRSRSS